MKKFLFVLAKEEKLHQTFVIPESNERKNVNVFVKTPK